MNDGSIVIEEKSDIIKNGTQSHLGCLARLLQVAGSQ